jgi:GGDEF domain-containing protein
MATFKVDFPYKATESDELSLEVGELIRNCVQKEDGKYLYRYSSELFLRMARR